MELKLERPLIFFDLETTGTDVIHDRVVELSLIKVFPDGHEEEKTRRINPERHIPPQATAVHHISDEDVKDEPTFRQLAKDLERIFEGCDIAGFNSNKFDIPLLIEEFKRSGIRFELAGRRLIDVQNIFHKMEKRTLSAAYKFYCDKELEGAHSATCDTRATYEVLKSQLDRYDSLDNDVEFLSSFSRAGNTLDLAGRLALDVDGNAIFNFGKHKGKTVKEVLRIEPGYYNWIMQGEFPQDTKDVLARLKFKIETREKK